jgi:hypothetical protein
MASEAFPENIFEVSSGYRGDKFFLSDDLDQELADQGQPEIYKHVTTIETIFRGENPESNRAFIPTAPVNLSPGTLRSIIESTPRWTDLRFLLEYTSFEESQVMELKGKYIEPVRNEIANQVGSYACLTVAAPLSRPTPAGYTVLDEAPESPVASLLNRDPMLYASVYSNGDRALFADIFRTPQIDEDDETTHRYIDKPEPEEELEPGTLTVGLDSKILSSENWEQIEKLYEEFEQKAIRTLILESK